MSVLLLGVGADSTNSAPIPPVYPDGTFEYIPIPERAGPDGTIEERTYCNTTLRHRDAPVASYIDAIAPVTDASWLPEKDDITDWPFHHDPNFEALTYGESAKRPAYTKRLRRCEPGDLIAFYTGLRDVDEGSVHRYLIGSFTVREVCDFKNIRHNGSTTTFSALPKPDRDRLISQVADNAHAKRYFAADRLDEDDGLVIVDGQAPGGLFDKAKRLSVRREDRPPAYELEVEVAEALEITNGPIILDRKPLVSNLRPDEFLDRCREL